MATIKGNIAVKVNVETEKQSWGSSVWPETVAAYGSLADEPWISCLGVDAYLKPIKLFGVVF